MKFRPARMAERLENCLREGPGEIEMAVKTRPFHARTKRPRGALLQLDPVLSFRMCSVRGSFGDNETPLFLEFSTNREP